MSEPRGWNNTVALITGAGSGLGAAVAKQLAAAGAKLLLTGRNEAKLRQSEAQANAGESFCLPGDVGDVDFCREVLDKTESLFGRVDVLINSAGAMYRADAAQTPDDAWAQLLRVNLDAVFWLSRGAAERMQGGAIVNVASTVGLVGCDGLAAYCASKGGVVQLTRAMALECAKRDTTVNAVCPGAIDTPMLFSGHSASVSDTQIRTGNTAKIPLNRLATAEEVARAIMFLASEPHITGVMLPVDGGYTAQ